MNFPEVWHLELKHNAINIDTYSSNDAVANKITSKVPIVKMISILLPEADTTELENIIKDSDYYTSDNFNIADILKKNFIDGFLKSGSLFCSTVSAEFDDSFTILNHKLSVHLHKDSLYSLPVIELNNFKIRSDGEYFDYGIDLLKEKLDLPKLQNELKEAFTGVTANFMWIPRAEDICSSSIAKYFSDLGVNVTLCKNRFINRPEYGLMFPSLSDADAIRFSEISEYVGMVLLGCNTEVNDLSSYRLPDDCVDIGRGKTIHCKGFITQNTIQRIINEARSILNDNPSFPWIAISIIFQSLAEKTSKLLIISKDKIYSV